MRLVRLIYRSILVLITILAGVILTPLVQRGTMARKGLSTTITSRWHGLLAGALGIRITLHGKANDAATLYVANHISWFDITALGSQIGVRFLSKEEVRHWPLLGWLASKAGTLYIKRGGREASSNAIDTMAQALRDEQNVCLFAEGTTTDGTVRKFHGRLMQSAIDAGRMVQPVAFYYPPLADDDSSISHADILYVGDTGMLESLLLVLQSRQLSVEIHLLDVIDPDGMSRDELATCCEQAIRETIERRHHERLHKAGAPGVISG